MRDPNRLYDFYKELNRIHVEYFPDWRFGQLMVNFFDWFYDKVGDPFFPEENEMIKLLREYATGNSAYKK